MVATKWTSSRAPTPVEQRVQTGGDGLVLGLSVTSSPGRMMTLDDRVPVAKMGLARKPKPKVPESAGQGKLLGLPGRTGEPVCGPGSVDLSQPFQQLRGVRVIPKRWFLAALKKRKYMRRRNLRKTILTPGRNWK